MKAREENTKKKKKRLCWTKGRVDIVVKLSAFLGEGEGRRGSLLITDDQLRGRGAMSP